MKIHKKNIILGSLIILIVAMVGCTPKTNNPIEPPTQINSTEKYPMEITDDVGNKVVIDKKPERIISASPSNTEILFGLGLGDKIVGVTSYCDYPSEAKSKAQIGDMFTPNIEKIIELQPDLVINSWSIKDEMKKQLEEAGIKVITYAPETISQVVDTIEKIGSLTDTDLEAKKIVEGMEKKQNEIMEKVKNVEKPKVFYEIEYSSALWTAGAGSFIDELITLSGGENISKDAKGSYSEYSVEALIEKDPDIYISNTFNDSLKNTSDIKKRPGYENIAAVKNDKIEILDGNILSRPSQRVVEALELMAKAIHPEVFK